MDQPNKAILDGDILVYQTAFWAEANDPSEYPQKLKEKINEWTPKGVDNIMIALSCRRSENFRKELWPAYKANRDDAYVPEYLQDVRDYIQQNYFVETVDSLEADDIMGINALDWIACTIDKDLQGVNGWHFNPNKNTKPIYINEDEAYKFFCVQWMAGDSTDNIPGLWKIGPKRAEKFLNTWDRENWEDEIISMYSKEKYKLRHEAAENLDGMEAAKIMAQCVKILDHSGYDFDTRQIILWEPKGGS